MSGPTYEDLDKHCPTCACDETPDVYTVNGVHYPVNASAIARLVNQKLELLAALRLYVTDVSDNGLPVTQLAAWEAARTALANTEAP